MAADPFNWKDWESGVYPTLEAHSKFKLDVLQQYVESYIEILFSKTYGAPFGELTIVDGFCGGGIYQNNVEGSPFVLLRSVRVAEAKINLSRRTPFAIKATFFFIDSDKSALACLRQQLIQVGYGPEIGKSINLIHGCFSDKYSDVISACLKDKAKRTIFFLDQCGYSKVDMRLIPQISKALNYKAEFIVNLAITWLLDFMNGDELFRKLFDKLGVSEFLSLDELIRIKEEKQGDWHYIIESKIGPAVWKASQCPYYSPFYVRPVDTRRGYWLLHLAPHERARTAMMDVLWANGNGTLHYGGRGLRMHEYRPENDQSLYFDGFSLVDMNREICAQDLAKDIGSLFRAQGIQSISFGELLKGVCNDTVANPAILKRSLGLLEQNSDLTIFGKANGQKRSESILPNDIIKPCPQKAFSFLSSCKTGKPQKSGSIVLQ